MTPREHIRKAAEAFRAGATTYTVERPVGQSLKLFRRALWRMSRKLGYAWKFRNNGDGLKIRIEQKV